MLKIGIFILSSLIALSSFAKTDWVKVKNEIENREGSIRNPRLQKRINRAYTAMGNKDHKSAVKTLKGVISSAKKYKFQKASAYQTLAYAYAQTEKYSLARKAFEDALDVKILPLRPTMQIMFALAQLYTLDKKIDKAMDIMQGYLFIAKEKKPAAHILVATLYNQKKNKVKALEHVEIAISSTKNPKENWLVFAVYLNFEAKNYKKASEQLKKLVRLNIGKKQYWNQLAGTLINQDKQEQAVTVLNLAYKLNLLKKEVDILNLAGLYLNTNLPYQAAKLVERGINDGKVKKSKKSYQLLSQSYVASRELDKALKPLTLAADMSKDGKLYLYKGRLFLNQEKWNEALASFDKAIAKGGLKSKDQVIFEKSIAYIQLKKYKLANENLIKLKRNDEFKDKANKWLAYIESL